MKTKFLLSIICACSLFSVQAQVFPESDAIWNIKIDGKEYYYGLSSIQIYTDSRFIYSTFELFNIQGSKIIQENISTVQTSIVINNMQGVYIYRISTPEGEVQTGKIIIK